ncbi:hypothetical protein, partial [Adlercreutzia sp.]|uniref:hypothetical protein n=1 Tax=Adlercreutzia sp. TaxID=1872387 RepID=UPI003AEFAF15
VLNNRLAFRICRPFPQKLSLPLSVTSTFFFILNVRKIRPTSVALMGHLLSPLILSRGTAEMRRHSPAVKKLDTKDGPLHRSCEGGRPGVVSASA